MQQRDLTPTMATFLMEFDESMLSNLYSVLDQSAEPLSSFYVGILRGQEKNPVDSPLWQLGVSGQPTDVQIEGIMVQSSKHWPVSYTNLFSCSRRSAPFLPNPITTSSLTRLTRCAFPFICEVDLSTHTRTKSESSQSKCTNTWRTQSH